LRRRDTCGAVAPPGRDAFFTVDHKDPVPVIVARKNRSREGSQAGEMARVGGAEVTARGRGEQGRGWRPAMIRVDKRVKAKN